MTAYRRRGDIRPVLLTVAAFLAMGAAGAHHGGGMIPAGASVPRGPAPGGGTLSCSGLEALWESAGGSPRAALLAAEIAMAESGGRQYATDANGGRSTDRGYWQINDAHGSLSTYDAHGNARAAVRISRDGTDWSPWVTYNTGAYAGRC